jgi:hypothetical protein
MAQTETTAMVVVTEASVSGEHSYLWWVVQVQATQTVVAIVRLEMGAQAFLAAQADSIVVPPPVILGHLLDQGHLVAAAKTAAREHRHLADYVLCLHIIKGQRWQ